MGCVYKIQFPCGLSYIGATKRDILDRLKQHQKGDNAGHDNLKKTLMKSLVINELYSALDILYIGDNYKDYEGYLIAISDCGLNSLQPKFNMNIALSIHENIEKYNMKFKKVKYPNMYKECK